MYSHNLLNNEEFILLEFKVKIDKIFPSRFIVIKTIQIKSSKSFKSDL